MSDIDYTDPKYKDAAFALAEATPRHLDRPTTPPIHWRLEVGADHDPPILRVLLADGRTVRGVVPVPAKQSRFPHGTRGAPLAQYQKKDKKPVASKLMALPVHSVDAGLPPANLKPDGKKRPSSHPPTNFKAGH